MEESKYYTPTIEEFYVGFEYEEYYRTLNSVTGAWNNTWNPRVYELGLYMNYENESEIPEYLSKGEIRVKYLDIEDIESFGLRYNEVHNYWYTFIGQAESIELYYDPSYHKVKIIYEDQTDEYSKRSFKFHGVIKNKSELKKLLQQLNIVKNG